MIILRDIRRSFAGNEGEREILAGVSFEVPTRSFTTIFGPNGCGKSTLINIVAGLDRADSGSVIGTTEIHGHIGYVFQDYRRSLLPWYTVRQNILFPLSLRGVKGKEAETRLHELLRTTGISIDLNQRVYTLSGGQAQTVCILRALIIDPQLLILDEPFAALDYEKTLSLRETLSAICERLGLTVLFISHDLDEAIALGDQVVFFSRPPTRVHTILQVDLPRPRTTETLTTEKFHRLKCQALEIFRSCVGSLAESHLNVANR